MTLHTYGRCTSWFAPLSAIRMECLRDHACITSVQKGTMQTPLPQTELQGLVSLRRQDVTELTE